MNVLLYWMVWLSLSAFAAGELAKARQLAGAWSISAAGAILMAVHIVLAMAVRHEWSHALAVEQTARQTNDMFGLNWGGGLYVNYVFAIVWMAELFVWRQWPEGYAKRPGWITWLLRGFYFVIVLSAAVVFATGWRRWMGAAIVAAVLASWSVKTRSGPGNRPSRPGSP
jgi:hypothetical protein